MKRLYKKEINFTKPIVKMDGCANCQFALPIYLPFQKRQTGIKVGICNFQQDLIVAEANHGKKSYFASFSQIYFWLNENTIIRIFLFWKAWQFRYDQPQPNQPPNP